VKLEARVERGADSSLICKCTLQQRQNATETADAAEGAMVLGPLLSHTFSFLRQ